jgi:ankyrin repeat protein
VNNEKISLSPLLRALDANNFTVADFLLDQGANINQQFQPFGSSILEEFCSIFERELVVRWLIEHGVNVNLRNQANLTALHYACRMNFFNTVKLLVQAGAQVNDDLHPPLLFACNRENIELIDYLVNHGADINGTSPETGRNALHFACSLNHSKNLLKALLSHGINRNTLDNLGQLPADLTDDQEKKDIIKWFPFDPAEVQGR